MKNLVSSFTKLVAVAACALTLGSCSRAEYAMLPKGGSYHGVTRVATPVPAAKTVAAPTVAAATVTPQPAAAPVVAAASAKATLAKSPTAAKTPAAVPASSATAATVAVTPAPKLSLVQRMAMNKVTRKVDKLIQKSGAMRRHDNTASTAKTSAISGNLRTGLIFLLVGLLISLFSGINVIFAIIGSIFAIVGLVFIILWLLDQA